MKTVCGGKHEPNQLAAKQPTSTIHSLLKHDWDMLHPNIQERFAHDPQPGEHIFYRGVMERIECSRAGWLFAHFTRIIGNPLTPHRGHNVRMDVILHHRPNRNGVYWRRTYYYGDKAPYTITSVKRQGYEDELLECVGAGFGMVLALAVESGNLHFRSTRYFWQLGTIRILLPHWLSPGATHVVHEEVGEGCFRFTISMQHPWLGRTFYQTGLFRGE